MQTRRDFLRTAGVLSGAMLIGSELLSADEIKGVRSAQKKAIASLWHEEKLKADLALSLAETYKDIELFETIGRWAGRNRRAVLNEIVNLYGIDLADTAEGHLLYTTDQIEAMAAGEFASKALTNRYNDLKNKASASPTKALQTMVALTVGTMDRIDRILSALSPSDKVTQNMTYLFDGGAGHYWALDRALIEQGIPEGACSAGKGYCKTAAEYPITYGRDHLGDPTPLSNEMRHALAWMWSEEKMAHDAFETVYSVYPHLRLFYNIGHWSETQHLSAVEELVALYNIDVNDYTNHQKHYDRAALRSMGPGDYAISDFEDRYNNTLLPYAVQSDIAALKLGCMVEVQDVRDLTQFLGTNQGQNPYVERTFRYLIAGSQSHYWAYHYALIAHGEAQGCCSAGRDYCKDPSEFPSGSGQVELAMLWHGFGKEQMNRSIEYRV
jgi:hypothetical protein